MMLSVIWSESKGDTRLCRTLEYLPSDLLFNDYGPTLCLHFYSIECNQVVFSRLADCLFFCM